MKKVLCATAAFMMVASVAAAGNVSLKGDARARWIYNDSGIQSLDYDKMDSRVRVKVEAKTESGAYAKARIRFLDGTWGNGNMYTADARGAGNVWADYGYLGFTRGNFDVSAGNQVLSFSPWFLDDERADRFAVKYKDGALLVAYTYDKVVETSAADSDKDVHGITYKQKFSDAVTASVRAVYVDDSSTADRSGVKASANVAMSFAGNNIILEQSYKEDKTTGLVHSTDEGLSAAGLVAYLDQLTTIINGRDTTDQFGGYAEWNSTMGSLTPTVRIGYTSEGFTADETFGWLMVGGDEPIGKITRVGMGGDTIFLGLSAKMQATEELSVQGNMVFLDIDSTQYDVNGDGMGDVESSLYGENPIEISGQVAYMINESTELALKAGWLMSDSNYNYIDDAFGAYARMQVEF